ncbi:pathogenesis-related protein PR-4-like [Cryptomeria japonica]|uniref:pathogenesis-related protein PR-4-like n=1 Tax=Cryptomeria japonica TaxID=3369 RepID=UPI0027DAB4E0|nr:pathogenesis-related protein PR-4-like [Cryptomeria japonica]
MASNVVRWIALCCFVAFIFPDCVKGDTYTTNNQYNTAAHNYALDGLYCATYDSDQTLQWRSQYLWTAYCDQAGGPMGASLCGKCIHVTNESTGQSVTVRIVDRCQNGGLDLEIAAFNAIDGDGQGQFNGHMITT